MTNITDPNKDHHGIVLSERQYDLLKDLDTIGLPALGTAYGTLATLYHWGGTVEVIGTIGVIIFLIGILLKISNVQYKAEARVAAAVAASVVDPVVSVNPEDTTKVDIVPAASYAADPTQVEVSGGSQ